MITPDSKATKHSMTAIQRQYIDSRIEEELSARIQPLVDELADQAVEILELRSALSIAKAKATKLEDRLNNDDKYIMTKANCIEFMKRMGWYKTPKPRKPKDE